MLEEVAVNHVMSIMARQTKKRLVKKKQRGRPGIGQRDSASLLDAVNHVKSDLLILKNTNT